jgi:hypothetical protein
MTVSGTVVNGGTSRYNVTFTVTVKNAQGATLGTARTTVSGLNPGERRTFEAQGTCSGALGDGNRADPTIESVTPA